MVVTAGLDEEEEEEEEEKEEEEGEEEGGVGQLQCADATPIRTSRPHLPALAFGHNPCNSKVGTICTCHRNTLASALLHNYADRGHTWLERAAHHLLRVDEDARLATPAPAAAQSHMRVSPISQT